MKEGEDGPIAEQSEDFLSLGQSTISTFQIINLPTHKPWLPLKNPITVKSICKFHKVKTISYMNNT